MTISPGSVSANSLAQIDYSVASARSDVVFILDDVPDMDALLAAIPSGAETYLIKSSADGLRQMADILAQKSGVDAVHVLSHGSAGQIHLGSVTLTADNTAEHADALDVIGRALKESGDILFYGCGVAAGDDGKFLIKQIATLTRADVAASEDATGSATKGGNWTLESAAGDVDPLAALAPDEDYGFLLAALPDGLQDFTGYTGTGTMASPDGFFTLTGSHPMLQADTFGAFFQDETPTVETVYLEVQCSGALGSFELTEIAVGEFNTGSNDDLFQNVIIKGYAAGVELFATLPYTSPDNNFEAAFPIDLSVAAGKSIDSFRVYYTTSATTTHTNFNLVSFRIGEASSAPPNAAPTLSGLSNVTFAENTVNAAAQIIDASVALMDSDSSDMSGGTLTIDYTAGGSAADQLSVATTGGITVSGTTVSYNGNSIGTISVTENGGNGSGLAVNLSGVYATTEAVQALIQAIAYRNTSDAPASTRTLSVTVSDGDGGTSTAQTATITVTAGNDAPMGLSLSSATVGQSAGSNAAVGLLFSTDPDSADTPTYTLVTGDGSNDSGNAYFSISGNSLHALDPSGMAAGTYNIYVKATDSGGLTYAKALTVTVSDDIAPTVTSVTAPGNDTYIAGEDMDFTVHFSEAITVDTTAGTPSLRIALDTGGTVDAVYAGGSGTNSLVFRYTVGSGNLDATGVTVNSLVLNSGALRDAAGNAATLTLNSIGSTSEVKVDGVAPEASSINRVTASVTNVTSVEYTISFSEGVEGVDASDFLLAPSGTAFGNIASVTKLNDSTYTVAVDGLSGDGSLRLHLNASGTGIIDLAGNAISGGFSAGQSYTLDHTGPSVTSVTVPAVGSYAPNQNLDFVVNFSEAVTVDTTGGTPSIALVLDTGGAVQASYVSGSGSSTLTFRYTVTSGVADANGITVNALVLNGGTIRDAAGNDVAVTLNSVGSTANVLVDGMAPSVAATIAAPADGLYMAGDTLEFTVSFDEDVTVTGNGSSLALDIGGVARQAAYAEKTANSITYRYTVQAGDNDADGIGVGAIALNGTTVRDAAGNDATMTLAGHVPATAGIAVDTTAPAVASVSVPADGAYISGQVLSFTVTFDEDIAVTGTGSTLALDIGGVVREAGFASATASSITYTYAVQGGDADADGISIGAISLNGTTIRDGAANDAGLDLSGHLPPASGVLIDTTSAQVSTVSSDKSDGSYKAGDEIGIEISFSEAVTVTGSPQLLLETGTVDRVATYVSGSGTTKLVFKYTVQAGDTSVDLDYASANALSLAGGTIVDSAGNTAALNLALPSEAGSLGGSKSIVIDTAVPDAPLSLMLAASTDTGAHDGRYTSSLRPEITGTAEAGSLVSLYDSDGTTLLGQTTAAGDGMWSITCGVDLAAGEHALTARASDQAGNASAASNPLTVTVDSTAATLGAAVVRGSTLTLTFDEIVYAGDANGITVTVGGSERAIGAVSGTGTNTLVLTLTSGVDHGQAVLFDYNPAAVDSGLQDAAGNELGAVTALAVVNNTPAPDTTPPNTTPPVKAITIDGMTVEQSEVKNSDGSSSQLVVIPIVSNTRKEETGNNTVADIPLYKTTGGESLLSAQLPVGFGLKVSGTAQPSTAGAAATDLLREIEKHTSPGSSDRMDLAGGGSGFLQALPSGSQLLVQTVTPKVSSNEAPAEALVIAGGQNGQGKPMEALVIDARSLPVGTTLELQNVEFAALIGDVRVVGGEGRQMVWGDSGTQYMVLGADDDELHGGGGDDTVGSEGGNDRLFGDEGNDTMFGGTGQDLIAGGAGSDTIIYQQNRAGFTVERNGNIVTVRSTADPTDADTLVNVETIRFADETLVLNKEYAAASTAKVVAGLYVALYNRAPDSEGLQYWIQQADSGTQSLHDIATMLCDVAKYDQLYASTLSNSEFVARIYQNVLGIEGDAAGRAFWTQMIDKGVSRKEFIGDFVAAALNFNPDASTATGTDLANATLAMNTLVNKAEVGLHYAAVLAGKSNGEVDSEAYLQSIDVLAGIGDTEVSVESALVKIDLIGGQTGFGSAVANGLFFA